MPCVFRVTDKILSAVLGKSEFNSISELRDVFTSLVNKSSVIPVNIQAKGEGFSRRKYAKVYQDDISEGIKLQIVMPGAEFLDRLSFGRGLIQEPEFYGTHDTKVLTFESIDNFLAFYLANYLFVDTVDNLEKLTKSLESTLAKTLDRLDSPDVRGKVFAIEDLNFATSLVEYGKILYGQAGKQIPDTLNEFYEKIKEKIDKYHGDKREQEQVKAANKKNTEKVLPIPEQNLVYFNTYDVVVKDGVKTENDKQGAKLRRELVRGIKDHTQYRIKLSKGSADFYQDLTDQGVPLTEAQANSGVVGILVDLDGNPVYLSKEGLTTDLSSARRFKYKIGEEEKESPVVYLLLPNQYNKLKEDFLNSSNPDSFTFNVHATKVQGEYEEKKTFKESGYDLTKITFNDLKNEPYAGVAYLINNDRRVIVNPTTLNEEEIQEIVPLLQHTYEDQNQLIKVVEYLNDLISISDKKIKESKGKEGREISFAVGIDRIYIVPQRIKEGDKFIDIDSPPIIFEENPDLVLNSLKSARVRLRKEEGENKIKLGWNKYQIKDGEVVELRVNEKESIEFYENHLSSIATQVFESTQLVTYSERVIPKKKPVIGMLQIEKGKEYTLGEIQQLLFFPLTNPAKGDSNDKIKHKEYYRQLWNAVYNMSNTKFVFEDFQGSHPDTYAMYDPNTKVTTLHYSNIMKMRDNFKMVNGLVEEVYHNVTLNRLREYKETEEFKRLEDDYERAKELRDTYKEHPDYLKLDEQQKRDLDSRVDYYLQNIEEFIVGISNPHFRFFLKLGQSRDLTLLDKVIDSIKKLLNRILKDVAPSLYTDVTTDLFDFLLGKPTEVNLTENIQISEVDVEEQKTEIPKKKLAKKEEKELRKYYSAPMKEEIDLVTVRGVDAEVAQYLMNSGQFGSFVQGELNANEVWVRVYNNLVEEYEQSNDDERIGWIEYFTEKEDEIKKAWAEKSKLFAFSNDKLYIGEDLVEEDGDERSENVDEMEGKDPGYNAVDNEQSKTRLELADKFAKMFVKLTPMIENGQVVKIKGMIQLADFTVLWNKLQRELESTLGYDEQLFRLNSENVQSRIPEASLISERLEMLSNTPQDILILNSIQNSLSAVKAPIWFPIFKEGDGYEYSYFEQASLDSQNIELNINNKFREFSKKFETKINIDGNEIPTVDNEKLAQHLKSAKTLKDKLSIYREMGFDIPENTTAFVQDSKFGEFDTKLISLLEKRDGHAYIMNGEFTGYIKSNKYWEGLPGKLETSEGISTSFNQVISEISKTSKLTVSNMTKNAEGQNQSILLSWSSWMINLKRLNEGQSFRSKNPIYKYSLLAKANELNPVTPLNLSGSMYFDGLFYEGKTSMNLDYTSYLRQEIASYVTRGWMEISRVETKNSTFGYKFKWEQGMHPIPLKSFQTDAWEYDAVSIFLSNNQDENPKGYLRGEIERIQKELNNPVIYYKKYDKIKTDFHLFTYLPDEIKKDKALPFKEFYQKHKGELRQALLENINQEVQAFKQHVFKQTGQRLTENHPILNVPQVQSKIKELKSLDKFLTFLIVNRRIYQLEHAITGHGDIGQQDKYYKRSGSNISTGTPVILNSKLLTTLNNTLDRTFTGVIPDGRSITIPDDVYSYEDENFKKGVKESLTESYKAFGIDKSDSEIEQDTNKKVKPYDNVNVADGQGFMTPDFGRMIMMATGNWNSDREEGFWFKVIKSKQDKGTELSPEEQTHLRIVNQKIKDNGGIYWNFPSLKMQYRGPFYPKTETNVQLEGLDKFSLAWLWPDEQEGKKFGPILQSMMDNGVSYGKFESGTKIATPIPDDLIGMVERGEVLTINSTHDIDLQYFKEQVKAGEGFKDKMPMSTQARKLIVSNLRTDTPEGRDYLNEQIKEGVKKWKESQDKISEGNKKKLIEEISTNGVVDNNKLAEKIRDQAKKRELPESLTAVFDYYGIDPYTRFEHSLSPQLVETLIFSLLKNEVVRPKFPGEHYVQVASTIYDNVGQRDLKFYEYTEEGVKPAECKITLSGEFLKLLNLKEVQDNLPPTFEQLDEHDKIEYKRYVLNELLKLPEFIEKHKDSITVYSSRIPGQGYNSMDIFQVKEFLSPDNGPVIVLPPQATKKSGTDFDYDKLPTITPELNKEGKVSKSRVNQMIKGAKEILLDPVNFHRLVTPNSTDELDGVIKNTLDKLGVTVTEPKFDSIFYWTSHLDKWLAMKMKNPLGIGAVNNTFYTLEQDADVTINEEFTIKSNNITGVLSAKLPFKMEDKPFYYPLIKDVDKLEFINQFINITVDVASNDAIGYTGLKQENSGLLLFLIERGVSFKDAFYFINQPIIFRYHQLLTLYQGRGLSNSDARSKVIFELTGVEVKTLNKFGDWLNIPKPKIYSDLNDLYEGKTFGDLEKSIVPLDQMPSTFSQTQKSYLAFYLIGLEMAEKQREAQQYNNFDTSPSASYFYSEMRERLGLKVKESGLFNLDSIKKIHNDSVISHLNVHDEFGTIVKEAFKIAKDPLFIQEAIKLGEMIYSPTDRDKFFRKFSADYLLYIIQNFGTIKYEGKLYTLMERWDKIKGKEGKDLIVTKYITPNYSKTGIAYPSLFLGLDNDAQTLNQIAKDLRTLYDNPDTRQWVKDFIEIGLYTTGFTKSPTYYLNALPFELVTPYLKEAFDNYTPSQEYILAFSKRFRYQRGMEFSQYFLDLYKEEGIKNLKGKEKQNYFNQEAWRYTDYRLTLPEKKTQINVNTYSGRINSLQENQVFVFGSNPLGINGNPSKGTGGAALVAYNIAGVKQGEKMDNKLSDSGKAWGITTVTAPGQKRSKSPEQIKQGIKKLYEHATQNPDKEFLIAYQGRIGFNLNGYANQELADMFSAFDIPDNVLFETEFSTLLTLPETKQVMKSIQMQPDNIQKIESGIKTTTVRSKSQAQEIGIPVGETQQRKIGDKIYNVTNRGELTIQEAGGKESILKSEGVVKVEDFKFKQTKDWVNGKGTLFVYDIKHVSEQPTQSGMTEQLTFTNHSGGALGADTQWDLIGEEYGMVNNRHYFTGVKSSKNAPRGNVDITGTADAREGASKVAQAAKQMWGYNYSTMKDERLIRNWSQVKYSDAVYAISTVGKKGDVWKGDEGKSDPRRLLKDAVQGGTGYAVEMAIQAGKPVYVFDQKKEKWFTWNGQEFVETETPTLTKNFAGIGTREINEKGKQAIRDVYEKTQSQGSTIVTQPKQLELFEEDWTKPCKDDIPF